MRTRHRDGRARVHRPRAACCDDDGRDADRDGAAKSCSRQNFASVQVRRSKRFASGLNTATNRFLAAVARLSNLAALLKLGFGGGGQPACSSATKPSRYRRSASIEFCKAACNSVIALFACEVGASRFPSCTRTLCRLSATLAIRRAAFRGDIEQLKPSERAVKISRRPSADCVRTFSMRATNVRSLVAWGLRVAGVPSEPLVASIATIATPAARAAATIRAATRRRPRGRARTTVLASGSGAAKGRAGATRVAPALPLAAPEPDAKTVVRARPRGRLLVAALIVAAALAAGVAIVAILATRGSDGTPATRRPQATKLRTFVARIENVLTQSAEGRREIFTALSDGFNCSISPRNAARRIASVADNRQSVLVQLGNLEAPTSQANKAVTLLQAALQNSIEADRLYRDGFVADEHAGCPPPPNPSFRSAARFDKRATAAKKRFVAAFNPLAERFHRRTWTEAKF